ncbi:MAG: hypothetical protein ABIG44_07715 [Planctomycetota bacterium]
MRTMLVTAMLATALIVFTGCDKLYESDGFLEYGGFWADPFGSAFLPSDGYYDEYYYDEYYEDEWYYEDDYYEDEWYYEDVWYYEDEYWYEDDWEYWP